MPEKEIDFQQDFSFAVPSAGYHTLRIDEVEINDVDKGEEGIAHLSIVDGSDSGMALQDRIPFHAKRDFGYRKFFAILGVTGVLSKDKKRTIAWFDKNKAALATKLEGKEFVGEIALIAGEKGTFANVVKYFSIDEAKHKKLLSKGAANKKKEKDVEDSIVDEAGAGEKEGEFDD